MSIVQQSHLPSYSESQVVTSVVTVPENSLLNLTRPTIERHDSKQELTLPASMDHEISEEDAAILESAKQKIYKNPLFPLLAMMFEKSEAATHSPDTASQNLMKEIQAFAAHHENMDAKIWLDEDQEITHLMIKAVQVLRIHLMEIEKVHDLCKDFCSRYITCLKDKLTSEHLLYVEGCDSPPLLDLSQGQNGLSMNPSVPVQSAVVTPSVVGGNVVLQQPQQAQIVSGNTVYQMVHTPQGIVAQPIQIQGPLTPVNQSVQPTSGGGVHGSTPLSQIGVSLPQGQLPTTTTSTAVLQNSMPLQHKPEAKLIPVASSAEEEEEKGGKQKRGILPKQATQVMKSWLFQHIVHPYPTEDEKRQIASQTNLTLLQVNNWFINARRRILQPMMEASNPDKSKTKKPTKSPARPQDKFWIDSASSNNNNNNTNSNNNEDNNTPIVKKENHPDETTNFTRIAKTPERQTISSVAETSTNFTTPTSDPISFMGGASILKVGIDGQVIPPPSNPLALNHAQLTLEGIQALQASGLVFAPGPSPLPFHLSLNTLSPSSGAGLGVGLNPFSTLTAASTLPLGTLNFNPSAYATHLQLTNIGATPIDLSTMSSSTPLQLGALPSTSIAATHPLTPSTHSLLMGVTMQDQTIVQPPEMIQEPEVGELKVDTKENILTTAVSE